MNIKYRLFKQGDIDELKRLVKYFYRESPGNSKISDRKIVRTCHEFAVFPEKGAVIVFEFGKSIVGYAIVFRGWSNELGKDIVFIDELYVDKPFRNKGIAGNFIKTFAKKSKSKTAALILSVEFGNGKLENFYKKFGFKLYKNKTMFRRL